MKVLMTRPGADRVRGQVATLKAKLREVLREKGVAADVGGNTWHDNFAFEQAVREEQMISKQLRDTLELLRSATIVDPPEDDPDRVVLGCVAEIQIDGANPKRVTIGGHMEADPDRSIVSYNSPLGKALMGAEPGDARSYTVANRTITVTVLSVSAP